jgi:hypothetical protein
MISALLILGTIWMTSVLFLSVLARRAPMAFEDENGFHVVEQQKRARRSTAFVPALRAG